MKPATLLITIISILIVGAAWGTRSREEARQPQRLPQISIGDRTTQSPRSPSAAAAIETLSVAFFDFEDGVGGPNPQGWVPVDQTDQGRTFFHIDDFAGLTGYAPISGAKSLWCGARTAPEWRDYGTFPGYGNLWNQSFESVQFPITGGANISFLTRYELDDYWSQVDIAYVEYTSISGTWRKLGQITGIADTLWSATVSSDSLAATTRFRIRVVTNAYVSDEDGRFDTNGAIVIDSLLITDDGGIVDFQDFEAETPGDTATADGDWTSAIHPFGNYGGLFQGTTVLQEDSLIFNDSHFWGFFDGSTDDYACGGHPEQAVVPTVKGDPMEATSYISNVIRSPLIALPSPPSATPPDTGLGFVEFDVYRDYTNSERFYYDCEWRFVVDGYFTDWQDDGYLNYGLDVPDWFTKTEMIEIEPGATHIQLSLEVIDYCKYLLCGSPICRSHSPLFDNVSFSQVVDGFIVTNTDDSGPGSLRQAILGANAAPGRKVVGFNIAGSGPHNIQPLSPLPTLSDSTIIDGYSQPGALANTNGPRDGSNAVILIELDGTGAGSETPGLALGGHNTVRGLAINRFDGPGIRIDGIGNVIEGNFIGTDPLGASAFGNNTGIHVLGDSTLVGGSDPAARNVISGNSRDGIRIEDHQWATAVTGNLIGINKDGSTALANTGSGISSIDNYSIRVGGPDDKMNVISGNGLDGIHVQGGISVSGQLVTAHNNLIGTGVAGAAAVGNSRHGVYVNAADGLAFVSGNPGNPGNTIAFNGGDGVRIDSLSTCDWQVWENEIYSNGGLGIDVDSDGPSPMFVPNAPVLMSAAFSGDTVMVSGTVTTDPFGMLLLFFYGGGACDPSGYGEGERRLGDVFAFADPSGNYSFEYPILEPVLPGETITALHMLNRTSEFSACIEVTNTSTGSGVVVSLVDQNGDPSPVTTTFENVTKSGATTLEVTATGPPVSGSFVVADPPTYYNISTTATFADSVDVCIQYDEDDIPGGEDNAVILHYDTTLVPDDWVDATTSVDTVQNVVCGRVGRLSPFLLAGRIGSAAGAAAPERASLHQNIPNPFNPSTVIEYDLPSGGADVRIAVYDVAGRLVAVLVDGFQREGRQSVTWNGRNQSGTTVATGIYFYRMTAGKFVHTRKMLLLK